MYNPVKLNSMINGAFAIIQIMGKYLFIKRNDNGLWDIPGGGFEINEIDYKEIVSREIEEEVSLKISPKKLQLCGILGQRLKNETSKAYGGVQYGYVFLHCSIFYEMLDFSPGNEHSECKLFTYEEIIEQYEKFSSGPLWMFFTYLAFHQTCKVQEGKLFDRRIWREIEYYER